jgi:hypothetical protein
MSTMLIEKYKKQETRGKLIELSAEKDKRNLSLRYIIFLE